MPLEDYGSAQVGSLVCFTSHSRFESNKMFGKVIFFLFFMEADNV